MQRLLTVAFSPHTHRVYAADWNAFLSFRSDKLGNLPASAREIREFVAWLSLKNLAPATIASYIAGVAYYHKIHGWTDPTKDYLVSKLMEGSRRERKSADKRLPVSLPVLAQIIQTFPHVCFSVYESKLFKAATLCAFFGFMRLGEFTATSKNKMQDSLLQASDIQLSGEAAPPHASLLISFPCSKKQ